MHFLSLHVFLWKKFLIYWKKGPKTPPHRLILIRGLYGQGGSKTTKKKRPKKPTQNFFVQKVIFVEKISGRPLSKNAKISTFLFGVNSKSAKFQFGGETRAKNENTPPKKTGVQKTFLLTPTKKGGKFERKSLLY